MQRPASKLHPALKRRRRRWRAGVASVAGAAKGLPTRRRWQRKQGPTAAAEQLSLAAASAWPERAQRARLLRRRRRRALRQQSCSAQRQRGVGCRRRRRRCKHGEPAVVAAHRKRHRVSFRATMRCCWPAAATHLRWCASCASFWAEARARARRWSSSLLVNARTAASAPLSPPPPSSACCSALTLSPNGSLSVNAAAGASWRELSGGDDSRSSSAASDSRSIAEVAKARSRRSSSTALAARAVSAFVMLCSSFSVRSSSSSFCAGSNRDALISCFAGKRQ